MYVTKKLRKNPFKVVFCPTPKDLFARIGARPAGGAYSGSDPNNLRVVAMSVRKLDAIAGMNDLDLRDSYFESQSVPETTEPKAEGETAQTETES